MGYYSTPCPETVTEVWPATPRGALFEGPAGRTVGDVSEPSYERIGTTVRRREVVGPMVVGSFFVITGLLPCLRVPWLAIIGIPWAAFGAMTVWLGFRRGTRPDGVLVGEHDDLLVLRDIFGRSRQVAWRSVARFRYEGESSALRRRPGRASAYIDLRDGRGIHLFSARPGRRGFDERRREVERLVARLEGLLERRSGPQATVAAEADGSGGDLLIGPTVDRGLAVSAMAIGALMAVAGLFVGASLTAESIWGVAIAAFGGVFLWYGWHNLYRPAGVLVHEHDDLFLIRDGLGRSQRVAWRSVIRFRAASDRGFVDLRDGSSLPIQLSSGDHDGRRERRDANAIPDAIARLNTLLDARRSPDRS